MLGLWGGRSRSKRESRRSCNRASPFFFGTVVQYLCKGTAKQHLYIVPIHCRKENDWRLDCLGFLGAVRCAEVDV